MKAKYQEKIGVKVREAAMFAKNAECFTSAPSPEAFVACKEELLNNINNSILALEFARAIINAEY